MFTLLIFAVEGVRGPIDAAASQTGLVLDLLVVVDCVQLTVLFT